MPTGFRSPFLSAVFLGGLVGGLLDIVFAISFAVYSGGTPVRLLQTVASGVLGRAAYEGGPPTAALGLALHFGMSWIWAALFVLVASRMPRLAMRPVLAGAAFGVGVFLAMRLVVLPLSAFPFPVRFKPLATVLDLLSHMFLFGLPIAWATRRSLFPRSE